MTLSTKDANASGAAERFRELEPRYRKLVDEIKYSLESKIREASIETLPIIGRVKSEDSFKGKIERKGYTDPLAEVADLAGAIGWQSARTGCGAWKTTMSSSTGRTIATTAK